MVRPFPSAYPIKLEGVIFSIHSFFFFLEKCIFQKNYSIKKLSFISFFTACISFLSAQMGFIENKGQWQEGILFQAAFSEGNLYIEEEGFNFNFVDMETYHHLVKHHHQVTTPYENEVDWTIPAHCLQMEFLGAHFSKNKVTKNIEGLTYYNYYLGKDATKWQSKVPEHQELIFEDIYPNIDIKIQQNQSKFKYDIILQPNAQLEEIVIVYKGAQELHLLNGNLHIKTSLNEMIEQAPYAYQMIDGKKVERVCNFKLEGEKIRFELPASYNKNYPLIIDPFIVFSRYSSSFANNFGYTATYDSKGNAYGAGSVFNIGYITTPGAYDVSFNGASTDIGISKYTPDGLQRIYATYLGGLQTELPHSIVVNSRDELFVLGTTSSSDFPLSVNCFDSTFGGGTSANLTQGLGVIYNFGTDLIISRFSEDGTNLLASTYLGGSANDGLNLSPALKYNYADEVRGDIFIDAQDNCYIATCTNSPDFPILNAIQNTTQGGLDGVVFKIDENLSSLFWSTYLGGNLDDAAYSLKLDNNQNIIVAGGTQSTDFPISNALQSTYNGGTADGFIMKIHSSGNNILHSSYYGSTLYDQIYFIDNNQNDEIYVFGQTRSPSGQLVQNAAYNKPNGGQFLAKFNSDVSTTTWSTRFGDETGKPDISPTAFLVDVCNQVFLSGWGGPNLGGNTNLSGTAGLDVTTDALDPTTDNADFYFMVMRDDASSLIYASFFGGQSSAEHVDGGTSRFDKKGIIYQAVCAGCGGNQDFPTLPIDSASFWTNNSSCNLGLVKYAFTPPSVIADFILPQVDCIPQTLFFENTSQTAFNDTSFSTFIWKVNDSIIESYHLNYSFLDAGTYNVTLYAIDSNSCNFQDSISQQFTVIGNDFQILDTLTTCNNSSIQIGFPPINGNNISYAWTPNMGLNASNISNPRASINQNSTYTLIVSNGACIDTFIQTILVEELSVSLTHEDTICLGDTLFVQANSSPNVFYAWEPNTQVVAGQGSSQAVFVATANPFTISCEATSANNCTANAAASIWVNEELPNLSALATPDTILAGDTCQLEAFSTDVNVFTWLADESLSAFNVANPLAFPLETTTYSVLIEDGICPNKTDVTVYVRLPECIEGKIFIPNAFSPNADGNNDVFFVRSNAQIAGFYVAIFDRWGQQVFESNTQTEGWNGTFEGNILSPAAFAWYCSGFCENGDEFFLKGNVSILK